MYLHGQVLLAVVVVNIFVGFTAIPMALDRAQLSVRVTNREDVWRDSRHDHRQNKNQGQGQEQDAIKGTFHFLG